MLHGARLAGATASALGGSSLEIKGPAQAVDDSFTSAWRYATKIVPLVLDFGAPTGGNGYRIGAGRGAHSSDPVSWRLEGSLDATTWVVLDKKVNHPAPEARGVVSGQLFFTVPPNENPLTITASILNPAKTHVSITWESEFGFSYTIRRSPDLSEGSWTDVATGLSASGASTTATVALGDGSRAFFQVNSEQPSGVLGSARLHTGICTSGSYGLRQCHAPHPLHDCTHRHRRCGTR